MIGDDPNRSDSELGQKTGEANGIFNENEIQINERDERERERDSRACPRSRKLSGTEKPGLT
jgi:hypothetical protein